jgi:hypothetical protein
MRSQEIKIVQNEQFTELNNYTDKYLYLYCKSKKKRKSGFFKFLFVAPYNFHLMNAMRKYNELDLTKVLFGLEEN